MFEPCSIENAHVKVSEKGKEKHHHIFIRCGKNKFLWRLWKVKPFAFLHNWWYFSKEKRVKFHVKFSKATFFLSCIFDMLFIRSLSIWIQATQQKDPFASNFPLLGETMRANTTTMYEDDVFFDEAAVWGRLVEFRSPAYRVVRCLIKVVLIGGLNKPPLCNISSLFHQLLPLLQ